VSPSSPIIVGRYALHGEIASGGMATIHVGRLMGPVGFARTVAIKRLHPNFAKDPEFVAMLMDEARLAARIRHPNVVSIVDVVAAGGELLLVMDYVAGESLARLLYRNNKLGTRVELPIAGRVISELLAGLHAAHEVKSDRGIPLDVVHRDVSPQNILVGRDGITHLIDFGVAKAAGRVQTTREGQLKGKLAYMAPEQIRSSHVDRRTDIYAAGIVLWETIVGRRAFEGNDAQLLYAVLSHDVPPPSQFVPGLPPELDAVVLRAIHRDPSKRFDTAAQMLEALEAAVRPATSTEVARWVKRVAADALEKRERLVSDVEGISIMPPPSAGPSHPDWDGQPSEGSFTNVVDAAAFDSKSWTEEVAPTARLPAGEPDVPTDTNTTVSSARIRVNLRTSRLVFVGIATGAFAALVAVALLFVVLSARDEPRTLTAPTPPEGFSMPVPAPSASLSAPEPMASASASAVVSAASSPVPPPVPTRVAPRPPSTLDKRDERIKKRGW